MEKNPGPRRDEVCFIAVWGLDRRYHVTVSFTPWFWRTQLLSPGWEERGPHLFMLKKRGYMPAHQAWSSPMSLLSAGEPRMKADLVQAAIEGAGVTVFLAGCLCFIYFV